MATVLVVAAHPDDELLGCGATLHKHVVAGDRIVVQILAEGLTSRGDEPTGVSELEKLQQCSRRAGAHIGYDEIIFEGLPDNRMDTIALLDVIKRVEAIKQKTLPDIVYTHFCNDLNIDHRVCFNAVLTAFRPQPGEKPTALYSCETPSSTEWQAGSALRTFTPTRFVVCSKEALAKKKAALECYTSEMRPAPHPRSLRSVEVLAQWRGSIVGAEFAECFEVVREIVV